AERGRDEAVRRRHDRRAHHAVVVVDRREIRAVRRRGWVLFESAGDAEDEVVARFVLDEPRAHALEERRSALVSLDHTHTVAEVGALDDDVLRASPNGSSHDMRKTNE